MAYVISGYDSEAIHGQVLRVSSQEDATSLGTSREMKKMCDVEVLKGDWQALEFSEWNCKPISQVAMTNCLRLKMLQSICWRNRSI